MSYRFNREQATVARHLRDLLDGLGHETVVLARPTKTGFARPAPRAFPPSIPSPRASGG